MVTGAELRAARVAMGWSLGRLARSARLSAGHLSRVERGRRPANPAVVAAYERHLGGTVAATTTPEVGAIVEDVHRRHFMGLVAAASVGAAELPGLGRVLGQAEQFDVPTRLSVADAEAVEEFGDLYTALDLRYGGGRAAAAAGSCLTWAHRLLGVPGPDDVRTRLHTAVAALADRIAWSHYDIGAYPAAAGLFTMALNTAAHGGDPNLRAHIMLNLSTLTFERGNRDDAIALLRLALGDERVDPAERANLHAVCARHCGGVGDRQAALRHLGLAETALAEADPATAAGWARRVTGAPGHFDQVLGMALFAIDDHDRAATRFDAALAALGPDRARTEARCRTRAAIIAWHRGDDAVATGHAERVLHAATDIRSTRTRADLALLADAAARVEHPDLGHALRAAAG